MTWFFQHLWLVPVLPLIAAGVIALLKQPQKRLAAGLTIGSMGLSFLISVGALINTLSIESPHRQTLNFRWLDFGESTLELGWVLDPLSAIMLVMVTFVGLLIFIYSVGYMAHDENFTRFFCFLSFFASAMLGLVIANSLLLLFICWELVGLASYLLIGFWYHKPSAAAAAKKAFITTRIGDLGLLLGMLWLYSESGTLLFYDGGLGCMEAAALNKMSVVVTVGGLALCTAISLLIFCGAMGKSGQVPLHVWLPDAMEGPTPVSALIHAATMVAAGVFLVARVYPLMNANPWHIGGQPSALVIVTWIGAITAVFAALIATAQNDIKRILAYSTVSQLGYMMMGLGVGGVAVGMFHLITHAFFKALLFMGAGSVIHGCHEEQDIRKMGGLKKYMPVTFATYAIGMLALAGFPLFAGFWSKDEILHSAEYWPVSHLPFYMGLFGALLTAFYMTRQVCYVFFGEYRGQQDHSKTHSHSPHESPFVMTVPLMILAVFALGLGFLGTPLWPWFQHLLMGETELAPKSGVFMLMCVSSLIVLVGLGLGWAVYGRKAAHNTQSADPFERYLPSVFHLLSNKFFIDELYELTLIRITRWFAQVSDWLDRWIFGGAVQLVAWLTQAGAWFSRLFDEVVVNGGFDEGCNGVRKSASGVSRFQSGRVQNWLRALGVALVVLILVMLWGGGR